MQMHASSQLALPVTLSRILCLDIICPQLLGLPISVNRIKRISQKCPEACLLGAKLAVNINITPCHLVLVLSFILTVCLTYFFWGGGRVEGQPHLGDHSYSIVLKALAQSSLSECQPVLDRQLCEKKAFVYINRFQVSTLSFSIRFLVLCMYLKPVTCKVHLKQSWVLPASVNSPILWHP